MGCWVCPKCDEMLGLSVECIDAHVCKDEDIIARIKYLEDVGNKLNRQVNTLKDGIRLFFSKIAPSILAEDDMLGCILVDRSDTDMLYSLAVTERCPTSRDFSRLWDALYSSWLEASELFSIKPSSHYKTGDYKEKFEILLEEIIHVRDLMGFKEEREWKSAQQALNDIKRE